MKLLLLALSALRLRSHAPRPHELAVSLQSLEALCNFTVHGHRTDLVSFRISTSLPRLRRRFEELKAANECLHAKLHPSAAEERAVQSAFLRASRAVQGVLNDIYQLRAHAPNPRNLTGVALDDSPVNAPPSPSPTGFVIAAGTPDECLLWVRAAEDFVASGASRGFVIRSLKSTG